LGTGAIAGLASQRRSQTCFKGRASTCHALDSRDFGKATTMTTLGNVLKNEITRLARKEMRVHLEPLRKANATQRREIAELKRRIEALSREAKRREKAPVAAASDEEDSPKTRFVAKGLRSLRSRLGLSASDFGRLAGASGQSIYNWETGKAVPRRAQQARLVELRSLGKREAQARLEALGAEQAESEAPRAPRKRAPRAKKTAA
jgi:DNA-binding transcriptional regulator YiaG